MKRVLFVLSLLVLSAGPLLAQDNAFVGTWKLNLAKSKFVPGPAPKSLTRTVEAQGDGAKYTFEGVAADGKPLSFSFTVKYDGKDYPVTGSGMTAGADSIGIRLLGSNKAEATLKRGGKEVAKAEAEVSKDGKVSTVKTRGTTASGKAFHSESVYDKQ
ncbi:MAG TPA: hypothetical protein VGS27_08255 [Candidatus Sulfotelmatobacter sp.]|nr:hypothetical protein [Candidatus Sulfotelmatobacter sp.]